MSKNITKIICASLSAISVLGIAAAGCGNYSYPPLGGEGIFTDDKAVSNGGFAVEKGNYVYFINGVEEHTAANDFGTPEKGAIYRISKDDLRQRNYLNADRVVPSVAYSGNYDGGLFIYGENIYYGTPSTAKNSEGVIQNSILEMKSSRLDGSETLRTPYVQFPSNTYQYRFVEAGESDTVYLLYVATGETLYEEGEGVTNLHSYNTATGTDTLLAYNVSSVMFDGEDKTNPRVYYTMNVPDYSTSATATFGYNQVYTVSADATEDKFAGKINADTVVGYDEDTYRYVNCGDLVLDGIGRKDFNSNDLSKTIFNYEQSNEELVNIESYSYTIRSYVNGTLFYTRTTTTNTTAALFTFKDGSGENPVSDNPAQDLRLLNDGSNVGNYKFVFNGDELEAAIIAETEGISINKFVSGKFQPANDLDMNENYFKIVKEGTATLLSIDTENKNLYYSVTGGNGYTVNRVQYDGTVDDYEPLPAGETDYTAVKVLDLDADSAWYKPEIVCNGEFLLFASETANMSAYNYVMAFDFRNDDGSLMSNADLRALGKKYAEISDIIGNDYGDTEKYPVETYANLQNALRYAFYSGDYDYLKELAEVSNAKVEEGGNPVYSEQTLAEYEKFLTPTADNEWSDYRNTREVNGKAVYANTRDYYYSVVGKMTEEDETAYAEGLKNSYLTAYPEEEQTSWYEGLSTGGKVGFIIGMCVLGLAVIAGATVLTVWLIRRNKKAEKADGRIRRIKVDTTDDKNIDVYADPDAPKQE